MHLTAINPLYADQCRQFAVWSRAASLWQSEAAEAAAFAAFDFPDADAAIQALHRMRRAHMVFVANLQNNAAFRTAFDRTAPKEWKDYLSPPPVDEELESAFAQQFYNGRPWRKDDFVMLRFADGSRSVGARVLNQCVRDGHPAFVGFTDPDFLSLVLNHADEQALAALAADFLTSTAPVTRQITSWPGAAYNAVQPDHAKHNAYESLIRPFGARLRSGDIFLTGTQLPTMNDAELDGIPYGDYVTLFYEGCYQPWDKIEKAQTHLIDAHLDPGRHLLFTNGFGTYFETDITGFTFANSVVARNLPGSEMFSAPALNGPNGRIVSRGRFLSIIDESVIENLRLSFKDGLLTSAVAERGQEHLDRILATDGMRRVAEIAFGTNPHLLRHVCNGLLVEKVLGTFHIALGNCYSMTDYLGKPVNLDNGNRSFYHWDISTMLGNAYVDGKPFIVKGRFTDPRADIINRGWLAVPREERPAYWQRYFDEPNRTDRWRKPAPGAHPMP